MNDLEEKSIEELQELHRAKRRELAKMRQELDKIEDVLRPKQLRVSAISKMVRAGLSQAEVQSLRV